MSRVWTMKLTASTNFCYMSDRNASTFKVNTKEPFMRKAVSCKRLSVEWTAVRE